LQPQAFQTADQAYLMTARSDVIDVVFLWQGVAERQGCGGTNFPANRSLVCVYSFEA
jgi:hypothetical protein